MPFFYTFILSVSILLTSCDSSSVNSEKHSPKKTINWYDDLVFEDKGFSFELLRPLGAAYYGGSDIGEVLQTARRIKSGDFASWYREWLKTANRVYNLAEKAQNEGHLVSARDAYFRASTYYRTAGFYMDVKPDRKKSIDTWNKSRKSFQQAIVLLPHIKPIKIPYENTTIDGYLLKSSIKNAPLLILHTGFDGTMEELYFDVGVAAQQRGFNVLLFDGPGQGGMLREKNIPYRFDWEKVVTPVVDYVYKLSDINKEKIALMGISMGGYLAPRACAFEHRLGACIANEGLYDFYGNISQKIPAEYMKLLDDEPEAFSQAIREAMTKSPFVKWLFNHGMWAMHADSPADFMNKVRNYNLKKVAKNIKCPTLIIDRRADDALKSNAKKLYDAITAPKKYYLFTREQAAEAHTQAGARAISNQVILDWLAETFNWHD